MPGQASLGPARTACTRCRSHKRKCDKRHPACSLCRRLGQGNLCFYEDINASLKVQNLAPDATDHVTSLHEVLTLHGVKLCIIKRLSNTTPSMVLALYSEILHPWFGILSKAATRDERPSSWEAAAVDFVLLCSTIVLLDRTAPRQKDAHVVHSEHDSLYLSIKIWLTQLEAIGLHSVNCVQARLLVTLYEVSHGYSLAAYASIANVVRAADALVVFQERPGDSTLGGQDADEIREMWWGIAVLDRYIAVEHGKWPPVTRDRRVPPNSPYSDPLYLQEHSSSALSRLFEASILLDKVHNSLHQPTSQISFNIEEVSTIVRTLTSFESVVTQTKGEESMISSSCLALSSTALILAYFNGSKATCAGITSTSIALANAALNASIADIVERVERFRGKTIKSRQQVPPFTLYLIYKAALITTGMVQNGIDPQENLQRLRALRNALQEITQWWRAADYYLELLNEDTAPRILKALDT